MLCGAEWLKDPSLRLPQPLARGLVAREGVSWNTFVGVTRKDLASPRLAGGGGRGFSSGRGGLVDPILATVGLVQGELLLPRLRIPEQPGHRFRKHLGTDSGRTWALIRSPGHAFRSTWAPISVSWALGGAGSGPRGS